MVCLVLALVSSQGPQPGAPLGEASETGSCRSWGTEGHLTWDTRANPETPRLSEKTPLNPESLPLAVLGASVAVLMQALQHAP